MEFAAVVVDPPVAEPPSEKANRPEIIVCSVTPVWNKARLTRGSPLWIVLARFRNDFPPHRGRIMFATKLADFRKGHDGLATLAKKELHIKPSTGTVYVFRSHNLDSLKLIHRDGSDLVRTYKKLDERTFTWPDIRDGLMTLGHAQFEVLLVELDWWRVRSVEVRTQRQSSRYFALTRFANSGGVTIPNLTDFPMMDAVDFLDGSAALKAIALQAREARKE